MLCQEPPSSWFGDDREDASSSELWEMLLELKFPSGAWLTLHTRVSTGAPSSKSRAAASCGSIGRKMEH
ncbi:hypothetical protein NDU88_006057 [Pleurodeles waltl]|uniref:Uncharacterized protein n=1 Tax=Pleurodeles waltl TaxID=8319 RepID=A0AAV7TZ61_PLEWA|nr:hypothetical protein NDU88_006057 [Pleurodeles waltl]